MSESASLSSKIDLEKVAVDDESVGIKFDENAFEQRGRTRRRASVHTRSRSASLFRERVGPDVVLPGVFKTISHHVDNELEQDKLPEHASKFSKIVWHTTPADVVEQEFGTNSKGGLSDNAVKDLSKRYGANIQSKPPSRWWWKLLVYFFGGFGGLLLGGGILCIISWKPLGSSPAVSNLVLGIILLAVFVAQAMFNFFQDFSSSRVMDSIHDMIPESCTVTRDGQIVSVESKEIVPGDIVHIAAGDKTPADLRITEASPDLAFDRSVLTGESVPVATSAMPDPLGTNYLESTSMAMQGTYCVNGAGRGIVVATGDNTIFGTIAKDASRPKKGMTPLQKEIFRFILLTCVIIVTLVVLLCILWGAWLHKDHKDWINVPSLIVALVSVAVAFMPEGLPIALTTCLVITANQMRKHQILCKSLSIVESLGSVSVLGFDKTGTLTRNHMTVTDAYTLGPQRSVVTMAAVCNSAVKAGDKIINGNATDKALLQYADNSAPLESIYGAWTQVHDLPFNSKDKYMITMLEPRSKESWAEIGVPAFHTSDNSNLFVVKGAPDILLPKLAFVVNEEGIMPITDDIRDTITETQREWASNGKRVLLLAKKIIPSNAVSDDKRVATEQMRDQVRGLVFVGLVAIEDPPRKNIASVITRLRRAGIKIVMITGDFELTGVAIAKACGIVNGEPDTVGHSTGASAVSITGPQLNSLTDDQWKDIIGYQELVFTRTTPQQKLMIIQQFQKNGHLVGMSGDGINDAPSLKQADVGISIADASDIAKEASDLILMGSGEELFEGIIEALKYGRLVFENLKKTLGYLLPAGTYSELWPVLLNVIFGMPQMLSSFNMIIICCITDCINAIVIAFEPSEKNLLEKPPRTERLVNFNLLLHSYFTIGTFYSFTSFLLGFINLQRHGMPFSAFTLSYGSYENKWSNVDDIIAMSSSIYFVNLVIMQIFNLLAMRTRYLSMFQHPPWLNKWIFVVTPISFGVTFIINYIPAIQKAMGTAMVPVEYYFISLGFGVVVLVYDELRKWRVRTHPKGFLAKIAW